MKVNINVIGVPELIKSMQEKQDKIKAILPESVRDATLFMHGKVKESIAHGTNAPVTVDTGRFLNSIDFDTTGTNEAKVFTDLDYAKFLEYGTSKMEARPHFRNTTFVNQNKVKEDFNAKIKQIIK